MNRQARFTFVSDRFNRTATAALIASLEGIADDLSDIIRIVDFPGAIDLEFGPSGPAEILCMSCMSASFDRVTRLHRRLRAKWGNAFISICGGPHATGDPESLLRSGFDHCCVGEGEEVIRDVTTSIGAGRGLTGVAGLFRLEGDRLSGRLRTGRIDVERYWPLPMKQPYPTHIEIGRGCRWGCAYCQTHGIHGSREQFRSPAKIEAVVAAYAAFGMKDFRLMLPNALGYASRQPGHPNSEAIEELLRRAVSAAEGGRIFFGSFPSEVRPEYVTEDAVRVLKSYTSNKRLVIGGQSGSQRMLDFLGRGHTVEDIGHACNIIASCGLEPAVDIMLGFPDEDAADREATLELIRGLGRDGVVFNMHFFMPLPGTPMSGRLPTFLSEAERRILDRLAQQGIVRGRWRRQEGIARAWIGRNEEDDRCP